MIHINDDSLLDITELYTEVENTIGRFVYVFNHFPERIMLPTIHDLRVIDFNRTYGTGVHLIGLNNDSMHADNTLMSPFYFFIHDITHSLIHHDDDSFIRATGFESYDNAHVQLEKLPEILRTFIDESYFEFTHEGVDITYLIDEYQEQQREIFFSLTQKLGNLTNLEELELKKAILILTYLELPEDQMVFAGEKEFLKFEDIEFTEENIKNTDIFVKLIFRLYILYEEQTALIDS